MITNKILVVDDEENVCQSVKKILSRGGYQVDAALNVEEAVKKINENSFDLVISDLMMPKTDGMELLQIIREHYPELEVIMITGYASIESAVRATRLGAAGYLPKPFTPVELTELTSKVLSDKSARPKTSSKQAPSNSPEVTQPDDIIDVDMPFSAKEVAEHTGKEYVETLTHSDIPVGRKTAEKKYCNTGKRECRRLVVEGKECVGECPLEKKERARAKTAARTTRPAMEIIDVDMPFNLAETERILGPDYINCMTRSDIPVSALWGRDATSKHSVLVIDDEPIVCHSVRKILSKKNCAIDEVFDVDAAMQKMKIGKYDLVLLDLKMPKRSGMEVLRSIKTQWPEIPVIIITGYGSIDTAIEATKMGAMNFLPKPFTPAELTEATKEVLVS